MSGGAGVRLAAAVRDFRRITPGPLLVRAIAFGAGFLAVVIALPAELATSAVLLAGAVPAGLAAFAPGSPVVGFGQLCTAALWCAATAMGEAPVTAPGLVGLACAMYVQHTACALAAAVPLDSVVLPAVLLRWFARTGLVMFITAVFGVAVVTLPGRLGAAPALVFPLLGAVGVIAVSVMLAYLALRRPRAGG